MRGEIPVLRDVEKEEGFQGIFTGEANRIYATICQKKPTEQMSKFIH